MKDDCVQLTGFDETEVVEVVEVVMDNSTKCCEFKDIKKYIQYILMKCMKKTQGRINPSMVEDCIFKILSKNYNTMYDSISSVISEWEGGLANYNTSSDISIQFQHEVFSAVGDLNVNECDTIAAIECEMNEYMLKLKLKRGDELLTNLYDSLSVTDRECFIMSVESFGE